MNRGITDIFADPSQPPEEGRTQTTKSYCSPQLEKIVSPVELVCKAAHLGGIRN